MNFSELSTNNNTSDTNQFQKPSEFLNALEKMKETIPYILDDFKNQYISFQQNPQSNEANQTFQNIKSNVEQQNSSIFVINNAMESGIEQLNQKLLILNKKIQIEKKENQKMKRYLGMVENEYNGSDELITNYKEMYRMHYFKNFTMILGIIIGATVLSKVFINTKTNIVEQ